MKTRWWTSQNRLTCYVKWAIFAIRAAGTPWIQKLSRHLCCRHDNHPNSHSVFTQRWTAVELDISRMLCQVPTAAERQACSWKCLIISVQTYRSWSNNPSASPRQWAHISGNLFTDIHPIFNLCFAGSALAAIWWHNVPQCAEAPMPCVTWHLVKYGWKDQREKARRHWWSCPLGEERSSLEVRSCVWPYWI